MFVAPEITVTSQDFQRLQSLIRHSATSAGERLDEELARAHVVTPREVASDVVTMNSEVIFEDVATGFQRSVRLVYPEHTDTLKRKVSILSPLGLALLGLRVGQEFEWVMQHGRRRVRVLDVPYQPEANGDFTS
jgi:regulator of nucleoside diphosphate kinase